MGTTITTGIDWEHVKAELERTVWEDRDTFLGDDGQERQYYLGTVFSLFPSGKYYMPWATSILEPCAACRGSGVRPIHRRRRIAKKWRTKADPDRAFRRADRERIVGDVTALRRRAWWRAYRRYWHRQAHAVCPRCGGLGCREAYLDGLYWDQLEAEAAAHGYAVANGEGDPTDVFVVECRDAPADDEADDDADENEDSPPHEEPDGKFR